MRLVIAGGGTGGHLFSGVAVWDHIAKKSDVDCEALFIGTKNGIEAEVLPKLGLPHAFIPVTKFRRSGIFSKLQSASVLPFSFASAVFLLLRFRPHVVLGVGGYAAGPVCLASALLGIPTAIIEQNAAPGFTNRVLGKWVEKIFLGLPGGEDRFPRHRAEFVGNPVREALFSLPDVGEIAGKFAVLAFGGSQGAQKINELVTGAFEHLGEHRASVRFIHLTGRHDYRWVKEAYERVGVDGDVFEFRNDMENVYRMAHWVISRSGALTVSELAASGRPSLLIPYPFAVDDHQEKNAAYLVEAGGAVMARQASLSSEKVAAMIIDALANREGINAMGKKAKSCGKPDAAAKIAGWIAEKGKETNDKKI